MSQINKRHEKKDNIGPYKTMQDNKTRSSEPIQIKNVRQVDKAKK